MPRAGVAVDQAALSAVMLKDLVAKLGAALRAANYARILLPIAPHCTDPVWLWQGVGVSTTIGNDIVGLPRSVAVNHNPHSLQANYRQFHEQRTVSRAN